MARSVHFQKWFDKNVLIKEINYVENTVISTVFFVFCTGIRVCYIDLVCLCN